MRLLSTLAPVAFIAAAVLSAAAASAAQELPTLVVHAPKADIRLEVASTEGQREHGLMDRTTIPAHTGMLFAFDNDGPVEFWMKDTLVPLDMIFIGADGTVRKVYSNVAVVSPSLPDANIPREPGSAKYVIELAAGEAAQDGIVAGIKLDLGGAASMK